MRSYQPEMQFDENGRLQPELQALAPRSKRRMGANPHANGGLLKRELKLPDFYDYAVKVPRPGSITAEATRVMGQFLRDVMRLNADACNFWLMGPTRRRPTAWMRYSTSPNGSGWSASNHTTFTSPRTAG